MSTNSRLHAPCPPAPPPFSDWIQVQVCLKQGSGVFGICFSLPPIVLDCFFMWETYNWGNCERHAKCCICRAGTWRWAWPTLSPSLLSGSLHTGVERRVLSVDVDRPSPKPLENFLEERLHLVQVQAATVGWKKFLPRKIPAIRPRKKGGAEVESCSLCVLRPLHPCERLFPPPGSGRSAVGTRPERIQLIAHFVRSAAERQRATSFIQSRQMRLDHVPRRARDWKSKVEWTGSTRINGGYSTCAWLCERW